MNYIVSGLQLLFQPMNLLFVFLGTVAGIIFGALPGFSAGMGIAVMIPVTFGMNPAAGLIMLGGIYCGAIYGGSISAVLLRTPGTDASALTAIDGFELTRQGRGHEGLTESAVASWWGGIISAAALLLFAPKLAQISVAFGPYENLMLVIFGMSIISLVCAKSLLMGLIGGALGLLIGTVGIDTILGTERYTFGITALLSGVALVPALIGMFSVAQLMNMAGSSRNTILLPDSDKIVKETKLSLKDIVRYPLTYLRSALIGTVIGILPGAGTSIATFLGYEFGKKYSKEKDLFGKGSREGVASIEAANNAVTGGSLIPTLTLGIPGNSTTAILMGGLMIQGLTPGYSLFTTQANITYPFILSLFLANTIFLVVGIFGARYFAKIATTPSHILIACISVLCVMGSFTLRSTMTDVYTLLIFGLFGYFIRKLDIEPIPIILGMVLGPLADKSLAMAKVAARGQSILHEVMVRPICIVLLVLTVIVLFAPIIGTIKEKNSKKKEM